MWLGCGAQHGVKPPSSALPPRLIAGRRESGSQRPWLGEAAPQPEGSSVWHRLREAKGVEPVRLEHKTPVTAPGEEEEAAVAVAAADVAATHRRLNTTLGESSREAQSGRRLLGTNGGSLWLWCCLPQPGALGP